MNSIISHLILNASLVTIVVGLEGKAKTMKSHRCLLRLLRGWNCCIMWLSIKACSFPYSGLVGSLRGLASILTPNPATPIVYASLYRPNTTHPTPTQRTHSHNKAIRDTAHGTCLLHHRVCHPRLAIYHVGLVVCMELFCPSPGIKRGTPVLRVERIPIYLYKSCV